MLVRFVRYTIVLVVLSLLFSLIQVCFPVEKKLIKPNILFICTDQQHPAISGFRGNPVVKTPNLDALAAAGMHFTRTYVSSPVFFRLKPGITGRHGRRTKLPGPKGLPKVDITRLILAKWIHRGYMINWDLPKSGILLSGPKELLRGPMYVFYLTGLVRQKVI